MTESEAARARIVGILLDQARRIAELEARIATLEAENAELRARLDYPVTPHDARMDRP